MEWADEPVEWPDEPAEDADEPAPTPCVPPRGRAVWDASVELCGEWDCPDDPPPRLPPELRLPPEESPAADAVSDPLPCEPVEAPEEPSCGFGDCPTGLVGFLAADTVSDPLPCGFGLPPDCSD